MPPTKNSVPGVATSLALKQEGASTTEDEAYCLLGGFGINIPLSYTVKAEIYSGGSKKK